MAKLNKGILDHITGKVGKVIGSSWNGINYIRSVPARVRNPNTPAQQAHRMRFRLMAELLNSLQPIIEVGFSSGRPGRTPVNRAMSYNLANAVTGEFPELEIDFPRLIVSRGSLTGVYTADVTADTIGEIIITWKDDSGTGSASPDDQALLLLYNTNKKVPIIETGQYVRADEEALFTLPDVFEGDSFEAYIAFAQTNGSKVSDSYYLGSVANGEPNPDPDPEGGEGDD